MMLSNEGQRSLEDASTVKYCGTLWSILNWLNEDQIVIYTTRAPGQHRTIRLTDRMLSLPTQAELLAARLTGFLSGDTSAIAGRAGILAPSRGDSA